MLSEQIFCEVKACPCCGAPSSQLHKDGNYQRSLVCYEHGKVIPHTIVIACVECSSCGHSHALLPSMIIPYSSFSLKFILSLLYERIRGSFSSVSGLCEHFQISIATFYRIYNCFLQDGFHLDNFYGIGAKATFSYISADISRHVLLEKFFRTMGYSFLQPCVRIRPKLYLKKLPSHISRYIENGYT